MNIILAQQVHSNENVVHVTEYKGPLFGVALSLLDEGCWVVSPVAAGVKVMGGVVAVVEGEAVAL